ncbi:MAG: hypothetical protein IKY96_07490 [Oscillospiraceae bacterium]|nr:hypothetical protein [Oscillospiraceae bacterium]
MADPNAKTHTIRLKSGANGFSELLDGTETGLVTYLGLNIYGFIMPDNDVSIDIRYVATRGKKHKVELVGGKGGTSSLYSYSATESERVFLSVLPDDQSLFRPDEDVHLRMLFLRKKNPFLDVNETQFIYTPVLWAVESCIRDFWPSGIRGMGLAYQGIDEDGNHVFYIHR